MAGAPFRHGHAVMCLGQMVSTLAILALVGAGALAGVASTVASLASVVSYPVLLALGLPPVKTSATVLVTFALTGGSPSASRTG